MDLKSAGGGDHPRIRGEHLVIVGAPDRQAGSSPHTRGARPVCVRGRSQRWDHPRIRGEHQVGGRLAQEKAGSSPHTRGARHGSDRSLWHSRIIPAYAGSTGPIWCVAATTRDHPRIRGEHDCGVMVIAGTDGSSPHTRGAHSSTQTPSTGTRIIPAYAGSTRHVAATGRCPRDHPRIRGEHAARGSEIRGRRGSSPHTRGALVHVANANYDRRIIPAYAGSTEALHGQHRSRRDHPRIRGEHTRVVDGQSREQRIIPAYAGSTFDNEFL